MGGSGAGQDERPPAASRPAGAGELFSLLPGDRVLVTGAGGFIGSAVARALLARGVHTVALAEPGSDPRNLESLRALSGEGGFEVVEGDLRDARSVSDAVEGCRAVVHVAAIYRFWARDPEAFYAVNVGGTVNVLRAALRYGCERVLYTSTVGTIGLDPRGRPVDEDSPARVERLHGWYKRSKYVAEHEVLRAGARGLPVVLVQPTTPLGPGDLGPTPTGKIVLDYIRGRMPAYVDTALNIVDVDDVGEGHVLGLTRGQAGRSYILGGENLTLAEIFEVLASCTGRPAPRHKVPKRLAIAAAYGSELVEGRMLRRSPSVPLEGAWMSTTKMVFDDSRARTELGYSSRPAKEAISRSAEWFLGQFT